MDILFHSDICRFGGSNFRYFMQFHYKMKILSVFTHPHVVPNLYVFICSAEHKGRFLEECFNQTDLNPH